MGRRRNRKPKAPVFLDLDIHALATDGRGVGKNADGKTVFVSFALPSERVTAEVTYGKSSYDEGHANEVLVASDDRIAPKCAFFGYCGGCALQHLDAEKQIQYKQTWLEELLQKVAKTETKAWAKPLNGPFWGYRYKARLGVKYVKAKGRVLVGFRERNGRFLADITRCEILHPKVGDGLLKLSDMIGQLSIFDQLPQIEVAASDDQVALNFRVLNPPTEADIDILKAFGQREGFLIYTQSKGPLTTKLLYAPDDFSELSYQSVQDCKIKFEPYQFTQVNPIINRDMISQAMEWMQLSAEDRVLDLFCGIGNFTLPIAKVVAHATGVEGEANAIESARENSQLNDLQNTDFHVANLFEDQAHQTWAKATYTKVLLDPPRSGALEILPLITQQIKPEIILYVSCNPATLARDIGELTHQGYSLEKIGVMDMFPHTAHVESMALLKRDS